MPKIPILQSKQSEHDRGEDDGAAGCLLEREPSMNRNDPLPSSWTLERPGQSKVTT
jgi:hypothetical protein